MSSFNASDLPNPTTPLAFLPPDVAYEIQVTVYVYVGILGAYVWDILTNLKNDYKLVSSHRVRLGTWVYFLSRILSFAFVFGEVLFHTYPLGIGRCFKINMVVLSLCAAAVPLNSLLFLLRASAIFNQNRVFVAFLFMLWLGVLGASITIPIGITGGNIGPTPYCMLRTEKAYMYIGFSFIASLIYSTVNFFAISYRLFQNSYVVDRGLRENTAAFLTGEYLPRFSRAILQDGQMLYLIVVTTLLLNIITIYDKRIPVMYNGIFATSTVMVTNVAVCQVFRNTKFGYHKRVLSTSDMMARDIGPLVFVQTAQSGETGGGAEPGGAQPASSIPELKLDSSESLALPINLKKATETFV